MMLHRSPRPPVALLPDPTAPNTGWVFEVARPLLLLELRHFAEVPLLPPVAREVMTLTNNPSLPIGRVVQVLGRDPVLAAQLLKAANSPLYGGNRRIAGLHEALLRIGTRGLRQLLLTVSANRVLMVRARPELTSRLQLRAGAVASASSHIARIYGTDGDAAFMAGLLHDIGWAVIFGMASRGTSNLPPEFRDSNRVEEVCMHLHAEVGEALAIAWNLPPLVTAAIGYHHRPADAGAGVLMAYVVAAALRVCDSLGIGPVEPPTGKMEDDPVLLRLDLTGQKLGDLCKLVATEVGARAAA